MKAKIETFSANPSKEGIAEIVNEINADIAKKILESRKQKEVTEQNNNQADDIYSDIYEVNSDVEDEEIY